jgi:hypothetical protein
MNPKDTRTAAQKATMLRLTKKAITKYGLKKGQRASRLCCQGLFLTHGEG